MLPRLTTAVAVALVYFSASAAAVVTCGVCAPTIFYDGLTRSLTLMREEEQNTVQCNYDVPPIQNKSPACLYRVIS
ncbi:hypothetical protein B0H11DRAFT_2234805 [Mycena galericulata]|nr:hypothetical protein B0H11DRAFT_2234805 [Mycena galericulata]